jgi:5-methylcytosine-specific restriction endonuclease McrA
MKKVEELKGFDGIIRSWAEIEELYYDSLFVVRGRYQPPINRLTALQTDRAFQRGIEKDLLNYFIEQFETIVKATPQTLYQIVQEVQDNHWQDVLTQRENPRLSPVGEKILTAFSYERLRKNKLVTLASYLNIKTCLYCNAQFTLVVHNGNENLAKFQFDHFFPKNKYPYLSISLYNLIPSCASCNQSKSKTEFTLSELVHPFHEDFHILTKFKINDSAHLKLLMGMKVPESDIQVSLTNLHSQKVKNQNSFTSIAEIYKRHADIVSEIYQKAYAYQNGGKEALINLEHNGQRLFADENELEWMLLANYRQVSDINNRPLSKFMQDIAKQAGLIKTVLL